MTPAPAGQARPDRARHFLVAACLFFCTGAVGMGYEFVWIRKAALVVGASHMALATVLTSFFLGLGLGSYVVGHAAKRRRWSPLLTYGLFELGIGAYALAFPWLFAGLEACYGALYPLAATSGPGLMALRFVLLVLLFLPPTFLMGGTLPLLLDGLVADDRRVASTTSFLYAINVAGAVAGVLVTCYLAIPALGLNGTSMAGGLANALLGAAALVAFRRAPVLHVQPEAAAGHRRFGSLAFLSGFVAIGYQIAWARYFTLIDVTTIYSTAMLLAVYLLGLSLGSLLLAVLTRCTRAHPLHLLAAAQFMVPLAAIVMLDRWRPFDLAHRTLATLDAGRIVPLPTHAIESSWALWSESTDTVFLSPLLEVAAVVLLPVMLLGIAVPAIIATAAGRPAALRATSGWVMLCNTVGAAAGAAATAYLVLPAVGLHATLATLGLGSLTLAVLAARDRGADGGRRGWRIATAGAAVAGTLAIAAFVFLHEDVTRHAVKYHGIGKNFGYGPVARQLGTTPMQLTDLVEGPLDTCSVFEDANVRQLCSGCVSFASAAKTGISGQAVQGHLPVLFFPGKESPQRCLGICLGSGQSLGALLLYPIDRLDVVDISPSVVELSLRRFAEFNHGLGTDPRVAIHLDDGRHFVQRAAAGSYDVVSMEPPPPDADGVHSLYSTEFYREVYRVLTDRGVLMQWLPIYRVTPNDSASIVKTLATVFPATFIAFKGNQDLMTLSYKQPPRFDVEAIRRRCTTFAKERNIAGSRFAPECAHDMASFEGLLAILMTAPEDLRDLAAPAILHDDTQLLNYGTGDRHLLHRYRGNQLGQITFGSLPQSTLSTLAGYFDPPLDAGQIALGTRERAAAMQVFAVPRPETILAYEAAVARSHPHDVAEAAMRLVAELDRCLRKAAAFDLVHAVVAALPQHDRPQHRAVVRDLVRNHFAAFALLVRDRVAALTSAFPHSPLVQEMRGEYEAVAAPERDRLRRYAFPDAVLAPLPHAGAGRP